MNEGVHPMFWRSLAGSPKLRWGGPSRPASPNPHPGLFFPSHTLSKVDHSGRTGLTQGAGRHNLNMLACGQVVVGFCLNCTAKGQRTLGQRTLGQSAARATLASFTIGALWTRLAVGPRNADFASCTAERSSKATERRPGNVHVGFGVQVSGCRALQWERRGE